VYYEYDGFGQKRNEHTRIFYANGVQVVAPSSRACVWGQTTIALSEPELQLSTAGLRLTLSDYLGSPRVVIDATGLVQERNHYYPSGLQIDALSSTAAGTSDYTEGWANGQRIPAFAAYAGQLHGRRYLDPAISSWYAVEPLATQYAGVSPYNYALGDPVNLSDATGMSPEWGVGLDAATNLDWNDVNAMGGRPGRGVYFWSSRDVFLRGNDSWSAYGGGFATRYVDEDGNTLLDTKDGSEDEVVVTIDKLLDFLDAVQSIFLTYGASGVHSLDWNESMKNYLRGTGPLSDAMGPTVNVGEKILPAFSELSGLQLLFASFDYVDHLGHREVDITELYTAQVDNDGKVIRAGTKLARLELPISPGPSKGALNIMRNLRGMASMSVKDAIKARGGTGTVIQEAGHFADMTFGEVAELAANGNKLARKAVKLVKDAPRLAQKTK
jgi:RHS repeat-associated protein